MYISSLNKSVRVNQKIEFLYAPHLFIGNLSSSPSISICCCFYTSCWCLTIIYPRCTCFLIIEINNIVALYRIRYLISGATRLCQAFYKFYLCEHLDNTLIAFAPHHLSLNYIMYWVLLVALGIFWLILSE